jgi:hypothetical protein
LSVSLAPAAPSCAWQWRSRLPLAAAASHRIVIAASACARDSFACAQAHELHAKYEYEAEKAQGLEMQQVKSHQRDGPLTLRRASLRFL